MDARFLSVSLWQVLCSWLSNSPNYEEITKWYLGWKSMFSDQVLAHPSVKDKFNEALDIMNRAVSSNVGEWGVCFGHPGPERCASECVNDTEPEFSGAHGPPAPARCLALPALRSFCPGPSWTVAGVTSGGLLGPPS